MIDMGIPGDFVHPDREPVLALISRAILEDPGKDVLDEVLAGGPVPRQAKDEIEEGDVVALKDDGQLLDPAIPDVLHELVVVHR